MWPCLLLLPWLVGFAIVSQVRFTFAETDPSHYDLVNPAAGIAAAESKSHNNDRRAFPTSSFQQTTLLTRAKILPPQQTLYLGAEDHTIKIPKGGHAWAGAIKFSPRSTDSPRYSVDIAQHAAPLPGVYTAEAPHADLHRSIKDVSSVDKISPGVHAESDTINKGMNHDSTIHKVENTGNPRIPFVMPRPPPVVDRKDKPTAEKLSRDNPKTTEPQPFTYNNVSVLPSLVVPVHERFPDREYGDIYHNEHDKHPKENKKGNCFGVEVAYDLPSNSASYCALELLYPEVPGSTHVINGSATYTIRGYNYGAGSVSKWDTWNKRPQPDQKLVFGNIVANTTGIFIDGGQFSCNKNSGQAAFFIEALNEDSDAEIKLTAHSPNSLVVRMYGRGDWLENYGNASHVIFPPEVPNSLIPRNEIPKTLNGTEEVEGSYAVIFGIIAYGSKVYNNDE